MAAFRLTRPATRAGGRALWSALACLLVLVGCSTSLSATPSAAPTPAASPTPSPMPSPTPSPAADVVAFVSTVYAYSITLPAAAVERDWQSARKAWDREVRLDHGSRYTDYARVDDGDLFVFGTELDTGVQEFFELEHQNGVTFHSCSEPPESVSEVTIDGVDAILHLQHCQGVYVAKAAVVHDGWGLVFAELIHADDEAAAVERFTERLSGLAWSE